MNYLCDVVVLTWNKLDTTKDFIRSFLSKTSIPSRLIIIDNASTDGTQDYLATLKDTPTHTFKIILNKENRGFVRGMNQGIEVSNAPYVCLSNNDLVFTKDWLSEIISVFEKNNNIGILNPNSNNLGTRPQKNISIDEFAEGLKNRHKDVFIEMPFCIGFCMVIKREVIERIGRLSEEFFPMFFEDTDYSMMANKVGYYIGMARSSYVWHKEHVSLNAIDNTKKEEIFAKSREVFLKKWGKTLRIALVVTNYQDLSDKLKDAIALVRNGNFIWVFIKNLSIEESAIFRENNLYENTGINFVKFRNNLQLLWGILKKKKRYDVIITEDSFVKRFLIKKGYKVLNNADNDEILKIKKGGAIEV